jgi:hypothetical protein
MVGSYRLHPALRWGPHSFRSVGGVLKCKDTIDSPELSKQSSIELQLEFIDPSKPPTPYAERLQVTTSEFSPSFFLMRLINCKGTWKSVVRQGFRKAQARGESPLEQKYFLSGTWLTIKTFSERITLRQLKRYGGLQGLIGKSEPGLYCFLHLKQLNKPPLISGSYYDVIWSIILLSEDRRCQDPPDEIVQILERKPKIQFDDKLLLP